MSRPLVMDADLKPSLCAASLEQDLVEILGARRKTVLPSDGLVTAAVLIPLFCSNGRPHVLLTERSHQVEHHKGEISFPGGKMDPGDRDFIDCALRETAEELGLNPGDVRVIGELDDFHTVSTGYHVVPFVGVIPYPYDFRPSPREIANLLTVPLDVFFDPKRRRETIWIVHGQPVPIVSYLWEGHNIWGATAGILKHFVELIEEWWLLSKRGLGCSTD